MRCLISGRNCCRSRTNISTSGISRLNIHLFPLKHKYYYLTLVLVLSHEKAFSVSSKTKTLICKTSPWPDHLDKTTLNMTSFPKYILIRRWDLSVLCHPCTSETLSSVSVPVQRRARWSPLLGRGCLCGKAWGGVVRQRAVPNLPRLYSWPRSGKKHSWDFNGIFKSGSWCSRGDQLEFERREYRCILFLKWISKSCRTKHSGTWNYFTLNP